MNKCKWCGRHFEKSDLNKFVGGATIGILGGEKYCSNSCKHAAEEAKSPKSSPISSSRASYAYKNDIDDDDDDDDNEVELLEAQLDHEKEMLEEKQKHELRLEQFRSSADAIANINDLDLGGNNPTPEAISRQLEYCITLASSSLSEIFDLSDNSVDNFEIENEKYYQSEKVVNAAIQKAELGLNKLRLCDSKEKAIKYMAVYKEQINPLKVKQIRRKWDVKIQQEKPSKTTWIIGYVFPPILFYLIYKVINVKILLPKKRDAEIALIK